MSKNISRKGIAFGALVALGSSLIAVAPAHAANELVFEPTAGTTYNTFVTGDFALAASLAPGQVAGNITQLKYEIAGGTTGAVEYTVGAAAAEATTATTSATQVVSAGATVGVRSVLNLDLPAATTAASPTKAVTVTAFIDSDNDNVVDSGEFQQARTINFIKLSEVSPVVDLTTPRVGDLSLKSTVALGDINTSQFGATDFKVQFTGTAGVEATPFVSPVNGVFTDAVTGVVAAEVITARASFKTDALGTAAVTKTVAARDIIAPTAALVAGSNATVAGAARLDSAFQVAATIKSTSTGNPVKAGEAVTAEVALTTGAALSATRTITVNGTVYNGTTALPTAVALTSGADGLAVLNLSTSGLTALDAITVTFKAQNQTVSAVATLAAASYTISDSASGSNYRAVAEGGSTVLHYSVKDQFGVAVPAGRLAIVSTQNAVAATQYATLSNGSALATISDVNVGASIAVSTTLEIQNTSTLNWVANSAAAKTHTVAVSTVADAFDTDPAATASVALSTNSAALTGSVNNVGSNVTVSSPGVTFTVYGVEYENSVTFASDATGNFSVLAKSNTPGAHDIIFTSGAVTKKTVLTVAAALETSATTITLTAPAKVLPGGVLVVSGVLADKYGNPVNTDAVQNTGASFSVAYTDNGQGVIIGSLPVETDADGKFNLRYSIAANQSGTAVVTVKYDADNTGTASAEISASKTVIINKSSTASASAGSKKITVRAKNSIGETVKVYVDGVLKSTKVATSNNYAITVSRLTAGKHTVKVVVSGKSVLNTRVVVLK
jgi:hypothetical protein